MSNSIALRPPQTAPRLEPNASIDHRFWGTTSPYEPLSLLTIPPGLLRPKLSTSRHRHASEILSRQTNVLVFPIKTLGTFIMALCLVLVAVSQHIQCFGRLRMIQGNGLRPLAIICRLLTL